MKDLKEDANCIRGEGAEGEDGGNSKQLKIGKLISKFKGWHATGGSAEDW